MTQAAASLYTQIVDAINEIHGAHPGMRAVHSKGTLLRGRFTAAPWAARLSRGAHLQGEPVEATVRFSNGSGDPQAHDGRRDGRGMGVKLYLQDGSTTDIVALTLPVFFVRTPDDFLEFTRVRKPDPETGQPDMERLAAWLEGHPEALPAIQHSLSARPVASYATARYFAIHAFWLVDGDGMRRAVRFRFDPDAGVAELDADEAKRRPRDYLQAEIRERLDWEGVGFTLVATLAAADDPVDDPTAAWPDDREEIVLGRLELTGPETERETGDDVLVFDPTRVTDGIELTDDPILTARSHAYAVSVERRSGVRRDA